MRLRKVGVSLHFSRFDCRDSFRKKTSRSEVKSEKGTKSAMSDIRRAPVLTPGFMVVGTDQTVVVEFPKPLPAAGLITLAFYVDGRNVQLGSNVPVARLGPCTVKANFPKFSRPGQVDVSVQVMREQNALFPRFSIQVLSALEAMFYTLCPDKGGNEMKEEDDGNNQDSLAILASILAFLANSDEHRHSVEIVDGLLCKALQSVSPSLLSDWHLGPVLSGRFGWDETLLHICARQRLEETALMLLQPHFVEGKAFFLLKKAPYDNKTPLEIARKNGMKRMAGLAEITMGHKPSSTPKDKRKRRSVVRASSIDTNLHLMAQEPDSAPGSPSSGKKKDKSGNKLKKLFGKEKEKDPKRTPSHQPSGGVEPIDGRHASREDVSHFDISPQVTPFSTLPRSQNQSYSTSHVVTPQSAPPVSSATFALHSGKAQNLTDSQDSTSSNVDIKRPSISRDQPLPLPQSLPRDFRQSMTSSLSSYDDSQCGSRVSSKEYESSLPPRDVVRPMAEVCPVSPSSSLMRDQKQGRVDYNDDEQGIYKVPKNVLRIDNSNSEEEEDIYKVPRNIPRPVDIESEEEDIYKVPKSIPIDKRPQDSPDHDIYNVPRSLQIDSQPQESPDHDIYNVPRSLPIDSQLQDSPDHEIYNVPRNLDHSAAVAESDSDNDDDHLYDEVPEEMLSEMRRNNLLHSLPEGHYMKVPPREVLQKHFNGGSSTAATAAVKTGTGVPLLDRLIKRANGEMQNRNIPQTNHNKDEDEDDGYDYPPSYSTLDRKVISLGNSSTMQSETSMLPNAAIGSWPLPQEEDNGDDDCTENIYDEPADLYQRYCQTLNEDQDDNSGVYDSLDDAAASITLSNINHQLKQGASSASVTASNTMAEADSDSEEQRQFTAKIGSKKTHYQKITLISPKKDRGGKEGIPSSSSRNSSVTQQANLVPPPSPPPAAKQRAPPPPALPAPPSPPPTSFDRVSPPSLPVLEKIPPSPPPLAKLAPSPPPVAKLAAYPPPALKMPPSPPLPAKMAPSPPLPAKMPSSPTLPAKMPPSFILPTKMSPSPPLPPRMPPSPPLVKTPPPPPSPPATAKPPPPPPPESPTVQRQVNTRSSRSITISETKEALVKKPPQSPTKRPRTNTSVPSSGARADQITNKPPQAPVPKPRKPKTETLPASFSNNKPPAVPSSPKFKSLGRDSVLETGGTPSALEQRLAAFTTHPPSPGSVTKKKPAMATPPLRSKMNQDQEDNAASHIPFNSTRRASNPSVDQLKSVTRRSTMLSPAGPKSPSSPGTGPKPRRNQMSDLHEHKDIDQTNDIVHASPVVGPKPGPKPTQTPVPGPKPQKTRNPVLQGTKGPPLSSPKIYPRRSTVTSSSNGN